MTDPSEAAMREAAKELCADLLGTKGYTAFDVATAYKHLDRHAAAQREKDAKIADGFVMHGQRIAAAIRSAPLTGRKAQALRAEIESLKAEIKEGCDAARRFGGEVVGDDDEPKWCVAAAVVAVRASLEAENEQLKAALAARPSDAVRRALEPFARIGLDVLKNHPGWANSVFAGEWCGYRLTYAQFEAAAAAGIALALPPSEPGEGWWPIETAPKDGTLVLVCRKRTVHCRDLGRVRCSKWDGNCWHNSSGVYLQDADLEAWMPLPAAPSPHAGEEE